VPTDMGYLSTLPVGTVVSICNNGTYCRGGNNNPDYDQYLTTNPARTELGHPRGGIYPQKANKPNLGIYNITYEIYKNVFYWLWVIEYANFSYEEAYNANLTEDGYH